MICCKSTERLYADSFVVDYTCQAPEADVHVSTTEDGDTLLWRYSLPQMCPREVCLVNGSTISFCYSHVIL